MTVPPSSRMTKSVPVRSSAGPGWSGSVSDLGSSCMVAPGRRAWSLTVLARGDDPPEPPAVLARGGDPPEPPAVLAREDDPPEPPAVLAREDDPPEPPAVLRLRARVPVAFSAAESAGGLLGRACAC